MAHAIWKGSVGFGLVNIPVSLYSGETRDDLSFTMLDKRDMSPVGYKKINKKTGEEVRKQDIVKAFEVEEGRFVVVEDADFKRAAPEKTQRVDIQEFVDVKELDPALFSTPYYLEPAPRSEKVYALLREALARSGKAGIATVVIRAKQYLAAVFPRGDALMLELMRFAHEVRKPEELHLPTGDAKKNKVTDAELKMAERLIEDLAGPFDPSRFKDEYRDQLKSFIEKKAQAGKTEDVDVPEKKQKKAPEAPADIMKLLKASVAHAAPKGAAPSGRRHGGRVLH
jgi:DNA end-binding protein Ku